MRKTLVIGLLFSVVCASHVMAAKERPIQQLPKDIWDLAFVWTEPIKSVAKQTRQFDPVSGVWFGLVDGSVKSVERTAEFFLGKHGDPDAVGPEFEGTKALLKYSF